MDEVLNASNFRADGASSSETLVSYIPTALYNPKHYSASDNDYCLHSHTSTVYWSYSDLVITGSLGTVSRHSVL